MTDLLLREIDEEVRKDRLSDLWKRYGQKFIALAVVLVLAAAAYATWLGSQVEEKKQETGRLLSILQDTALFQSDEIPRNAETDRALQLRLVEFAEETLPGHAAVATLFASGMVETPEQRETAVAQLKKLAANKEVDPLFSSLGAVLSIQHELDTGDPQNLRERLAPLKAEDSPWRASAEEMSALLALREGDKATAIEMLKGLQSAPYTPSDMRERVEKVLASLGVYSGAE